MNPTKNELMQREDVPDRAKRPQLKKIWSQRSLGLRTNETSALLRKPQSKNIVALLPRHREKFFQSNSSYC